MVDYVKILLLNIDIAKLLQNPLLDFKTDLNISTGEVSGRKQIAIINHCKITVYDSGTVFFSGSIHKFWNASQGILAPSYNKGKKYSGYNGNDFTLENIISVRKALELLFDCKAEKMVIKNIEFGVNLNVKFDHNLYIKGLLFQRGKPFEFKHSRGYAQVEHQRYFIKIYNKSKQFSMSGNVLRVEVKCTKAEEFNITGIYTIQDINSKTLENAKELLFEKLTGITYFDKTYLPKNLTTKEKQLCDKYSNKIFWLDDLKPNQRDRHKKRLNKFIEEHTFNLQDKIIKHINAKCVIINREVKYPKCVIINTSSIGLIITQHPSKICPITKVDISMQRVNSQTITMTGLMHYFKNDLSTYRRIYYSFFGYYYFTEKVPKETKELLRRIKLMYKELNIDKPNANITSSV